MPPPTFAPAAPLPARLEQLRLSPVRKEAAMPVLNLIATELDSTGRPTSGKKQGARLIWTDDLRDKVTGQAMGQHSGDCVLVREPSGPAKSGIWFCRAGLDAPKRQPRRRRGDRLRCGGKAHRGDLRGHRRLQGRSGRDTGHLLPGAGADGVRTRDPAMSQRAWAHRREAHHRRRFLAAGE